MRLLEFLDGARAEQAELGKTSHRGMAVGLNAKHVYGGTVPPATVARRRAKNKAARHARRAARR